MRIKIFFIFICGLLLSACGQTGPLYLPTPETNQVHQVDKTKKTRQPSPTPVAAEPYFVGGQEDS
jgi:predicted small lipoprotein YifL